ncbi:phage tail protein [Pseudomonas sp. SWRI111]|uniref:phage tail-collar fiber domain-containing protein n=1 Tax=Pseudomonas sp. SWRI111 TaxID=2745507 RepID=UPI00164486B7|nr:phage tail protein [Pseudomonas sp. SWRI111]MBC3207930.1 phage tail protein [Pseudomonas sp. SWRI111]
MIDANSQFFAILTNVGMAKQANADALGIPWLITQMGVGDANPNGLTDPPNPVPSVTQTKLLNEWRRKPLNQLKIDPVNPAVIIAEQIIPADEGGKWIREIGLYDADGDLVAVANCAPSFKPLLSQGSGRTQIVRMNFIVTSTGNIQLKIDPAIVLASRAYVDAAILEVLPKNKAEGQYTRVKVNDRGVFVSGDNPETLAGMGIKDTYTKTEIEAMIAQASALPVGATVAFPLNKVAPGFLELDGSVKSIAVYPDLAAFLGTAFNKGDEGVGNFRLPESRGEFLRGWDHGRGVDAGRTVGSWQKGSEHIFDTGTSIANVSDRNTASSPVTALSNMGYDTVNVADYPGAEYTVSTPNTNAAVSNNDQTAFGATRPRNLAVVWCIKAWNAPINQGNIDIAALAERVSFIGENGPVAGAMRNLKATVPTPSTNITFAIEEVVLRDAAGNGVRLNNFNKSAVTTAVGVGGMDAGPAPASAVLSIYAIFNPATKVSGLLLCNQAVSSSNTYAGPNLPAGFTFSALVSGWGVDASGMFRVANQVDRQVNVALTTIINMVTAQTARPVDISTIVPLCAREIDGIFQVAASTAGNALTLSISGSPLGHGARSCGGVSSSVNASMQSAFSRLSLLTPGMIYATTTGPTIAQASAYLYSYTI